MFFTQNSPLPEILNNFRSACSIAVTNPKHPFRFMTFSTFSSDYPNSRYVVLRGVLEDLQLLFYTDHRSNKVREIQENPKVSLHFYHPEEKVQAKIQGKAILHHKDLLASSQWKQVEGEAKKAYNSKLPPGTEIDSPSEAYRWEDKLGSEYFTVVKVIPHQVELLQINAIKHLRVRFKWEGEQWTPSWMAP
jgi:pyridoxamine 5'-phosphate oxidase